MANDSHDNGGWTCFEISCSGQQLETAKLTFSRKGLIYRVTCGPLGDSELARLERAAQTGQLVRLAFPKSVITLSQITLESPKTGWAQIEGLVLNTTPARSEESFPHQRA
jgi:hypothetical protein